MRLHEREQLLSALDGHLAEVAAGAGRLVLIAGEAGVGKTSLIDAWVDQAADLRFLRGACDGSATPRPLGPFIDAFPHLADGPDTPDRIRLLAKVSESLKEVEQAPAVLLIEDAHWADGATVDLLRGLAVRLADIQALIVVTYRSDEVGPGHALAVLVGDLAGRVHTHEVPPLSVEAVRALADDADVHIDAEELHRRTGGNAFHVTEVLASGGHDLPATVRDAVRARITRLSPESRAALDVVALVGRRAELEVVEDALGDTAHAVDEAVARGILLATSEGLMFRHDLARRTVADDVPPMRRIALHRAILHSLQQRPILADPARVAHHAEAARDLAAALPAATEAARRSSALGAHSQALLQYERALRVVPNDDALRVGLLEGLSYEHYLTGSMDGAITWRAQALAIHQARGDRMGIVSSHRWLSRLHWFDAHGAAAEAHGERAVELLVPGEANATAAMALSNLSQLRMLAGDVEGARKWGYQALEMARSVGADEVTCHALNNLGTAERSADNHDIGTPLLVQSLEIAIADNLHEHAARAYSNLVSSAVGARRYDEAEQWARPGIEFCTDRDLESWRLYLEGHLAVTMWQQGRVKEGRELAEYVLAQVGLPAVNRVNPLCVVGLAQARTGDPDAGRTLADALAVAEFSGELQRLSIAACASAELAWLLGEEPPEALRTAFALAGSRGSEWEMGEIAFWLLRAGWITEVPDRMAEPYSLQAVGRWDEAADVWAKLGCPYEQALALAESTEVSRVTEAVRMLTDLGASAAAARFGPRLAELGGRLPRQRRTATRLHPAGLTSREAEVLELLVEGASNTEVALRLGISARTAEHHVSAVLTKLSAPTRRDAVALARSRGWAGLGSGADQVG